MNMKKYIILLIAAILAFTSCDLTRLPLNKEAPETYFRTEADLELFSNSFYNNLLDKSMFKNQSDQYIKDDLSAVLKGGQNRIIPNSGGGWSWGDLRKLNTMLKYIDNCEDEAARDKYTGVCKFFRAFIYAEKIMLFGDVPYVDVELGSADPQLYAPRDSREYVMTKIIEDIDDAIEKLPATAPNPYRVNKWTALALKARFCLFEGTFRKYHAGAEYLQTLPADAKDYKYYLDLAAEAAKQIINEGPYALHSTGKPNQDYRDLFAMDNATSHKEYILAIDFDNSIPIRHSATGYATMASQGRPGVTKKIIDSYLMADGTRFTDKAGWETMQFKEQVADRDPRLGQSIRLPGYIRLGDTRVESPRVAMSVTGYHTIKFVQDYSTGSHLQTSMSYNDLPIFRLGEVYLNYAEALAENDKLTQEDLNISVNKLRDRVGMPKLDMATANANPDPYLSSPEYGYVNVTGANKGVILEIRRERTIELAQEGEFRYFDLMRWKEGKCIEQDMHGLYVPGVGMYDLSGDGVADLVIWKDTKPAGIPPSADVFELDREIFLSDGESGYLSPHRDIVRVFDESRDYLYPIPINERSLNNNLTQNPNWNDGLNF